MQYVETDPEILVDQNPVLVDAARPHYDETLDYHNFAGHILGTWETARKIAAVCIDQGHDIDLAALDAAVVYHDTDFFKPLPKNGFKTKERRSASIARRELPELDLGFTPDQIKNISGSIISTTSGVRPTTKEGAILNRADIFNIGQSLPEFLGSSVRVVREHFRLNGMSMDYPLLKNWLNGSAGVLMGYLDNPSQIPGFELPEILEANDSFRDRGLLNIGYLGNMTVSALYHHIMGEQT